VTVEQKVSALKGLKPKVIDAKVAGMLAGKINPKSPIFSNALAHRAALVTVLREEEVWPDWVRS